MNKFITRISYLIPTGLIVCLLFISGHFCAFNNFQTKTNHSHDAKELTKHYNLQNCCQSNNMIELENALVQKNTNSYEDIPFLKTTLTYHTTDTFVSNQPLLNLDSPPPNKYTKQTSRILIC